MLLNPIRPFHPQLRKRTVAAVCAMVCSLGMAAHAATDLMISEYIEGSSNNKAVEFHNGTAAAIDLAAGAYKLQVYFNGATSASLTINLSGTVAPGGVFVLAQGSASAAILAKANQTNASAWFNGDDALVLSRGGTVIDSIGQIGVDPGTEWGTGLVSTQDNTLRRKSGITAGDTNPNDPFDPAQEWDGFAVDVISDLGVHAGGGDTGGEPPPPPPPPTDPISATDCAAPFTAAYTIQGRGAATLLSGVVTTQGVVVGDYEGPSPALRGFYLQDLLGDGDAATSDAVFVFNGDNNSVQPGQVVRVVGTVGEFQNQTQLSASSIAQCGTGSVAPTDLTLPMASPDDFERVEGMLVRFSQPLYVTEHFQLGRFGQVVLSSGGRLPQPTNVALPGAPALAVQAANNLNRITLDDTGNGQNPDPIVFGRQGQPLSATNTLRGGDRTSEIVGVLTYTWSGNAASGNTWRLRPGNALGGAIADFEAFNPRPGQVPAIGGSLRVAGMNVLNYFNSFSACTGGVLGAAMDCRGAENAAEFTRQQAKTIAALVEMQADVVGLVEIENDGYGVNSAIRQLVEALNTATTPGNYAVLDVDTRTGQANAMGTDAIKVGFIYRPAAVQPVGTTAALNSTAFQNGGDSAPRNRPALAQAFQQLGGTGAGERFIAVVNHLKSKGSACDTPDAGDGQANCNAVRVNAANLLRSWLAGNPTGTADPDVLVLGDLNAYAKEDPIRVFTGNGWTNLIEAYGGPDAYSYAFDGQWGYLDHALATASLAGQVTGVADWHVNADEPNTLDYNTNFKSAAQLDSLYAPDPFRNSDHDPVIVGLNLVAPGTCTQPDASPTVVLGTTSSGVANRVVDKGCTIDDLIRDEQVWSSTSAFLAHVSKVSFDLLKLRKITSAERSKLMVAAQASGVGSAP
jgi:predicted extracellular nuclease